ncbi:MAG: hypothetical protein CMC08_06335, partial [Flavobacteriaceae bacterium]|nr:hypothetical protein [Flavobacteriaceae bacterium]
DGQSFTETAFFDTYPSNNNASTSGAWNVYPYFTSGNIVISDISRGLFIVKSNAPDSENPVAVCKDITVPLGSDGTLILSANMIDDGSSDNSGFAALSVSPNSFSCNDLGNRTVTLTVTDPSGNTDTCTATVTIVDTIAPSVTCPADTTADYDNGQAFYTVPDYVAEGLLTVADNCTANPTVVQNPAPGTQLSQGTYTVEFDITDSSGNDAECTFELTVVEVLSTGQPTLENELVLYPNPFGNQITIESGNTILEQVQIIDIQGKTVIQIENIDATTARVDTANLSNGMYFVRINNSVTRKIVKQ